MALPTTITGLSTTVACLGPFKSSGGNYYFFGKDSSITSQIDAYKASDPTSSFSSVATRSLTAELQAWGAYQVGDTIHIITSNANGVTTVNIQYTTFDMSSDTFPIFESVQTGIDTSTSGGGAAYGASVVARSGGEVVLLYNGTRVANMGNSYAQVYYNRRTGTNTYSGATQVSAGGQVDFNSPEAALGQSDRVQFWWNNATAGTLRRRALSSGNVLQTEQTNATSVTLSWQSISYDSSGTQKLIAIFENSSGGPIKVDKFDDANTPAFSIVDVESNSTFPARLFNDGTTAYAMYRDDASSDLYVESSTDHGATWGSKTQAFAATVARADANLSKDGNIYQRGNDYVIPYVVNDNGTLKYNEYVVRSVAAANPAVGWEAQGAQFIFQPAPRAIGGSPQ